MQVWEEMLFTIKETVVHGVTYPYENIIKLIKKGPKMIRKKMKVHLSIWINMLINNGWVMMATAIVTTFFFYRCKIFHSFFNFEITKGKGRSIKNCRKWLNSLHSYSFFTQKELMIALNITFSFSELLKILLRLSYRN